MNQIYIIATDPNTDMDERYQIARMMQWMRLEYTGGIKR